MNKLIIALAILGSTILNVNAQTACNTHVLRTLFVFSSPANAEVVDGQQYCESLKGEEHCCDESVINGFQDKITEISETLQATVETRDEEIINLRNEMVEGAQTFADFLTAVAGSAEGLTALETADIGSTTDVSAGITKISALITELTDNFSELQESFETYQTGRQSCINQILKLQAAAWCTACNADPDSNGFDGTNLDPSDEVIERITTACHEFFAAANVQNTVIELGAHFENIGDMTAALGKIAEEDVDGITEFETALGQVAAKKTVAVTGTCDAEACDWIFSDLWKDEILNNEYLALGGETTTLGSRRLLPARKLTGGAWNPEEDEAGVSVDFPKNPAGVDNSAKLTGIIACVVAGIMTLFF